MEDKLWSRKEAAASLKISERTLIRRVEEAGVEWAEEVLPNGAIAKRLRDVDFNKLAAALLVVDPLPDAGPGEGKPLTVAANNLRMEIVRAHADADMLRAEVGHRDDIISRLETDKARLEGEVDRLLGMLGENKKVGFWARLRGK